jgi:hypothetical protein
MTITRTAEKWVVAKEIAEWFLFPYFSYGCHNRETLLTVLVMAFSLVSVIPLLSRVLLVTSVAFI